MKYLSVCSGIEAASVAWEPLGFTPVAFSEIEAFPSAVLNHRYPATPNLGDMTKYAQWNLSAKPDILVGGTPCQSFSVAGLRGGIADPRGSLMLTYIAIANRHDPGFIVWENVPGVLSSKDNAFGCFLGALCGEGSPLQPAGGKWSNAGYVAGPQRNVAWRIFDAQWFGVAQRRRRVFVVGCPVDGADPTEVLFEREGVQRHSPPSRAKRQDAAPDAGASLEGGGGSSHWDDDGNPHPTLNRGGMGQIGYSNQEIFSQRGGGLAKGFRLEAFGKYADDETASTMKRRDYKDATDLVVDEQPAVRRLLPVEAERLQGFPDGWTDVPFRNKPASDGHRYKALGNSMAVPCMAWIGKRISQLTTT